MDRDARAAIKKLHKDTHDFAVATVQRWMHLTRGSMGCLERIDTTAAAVEQQMDLLLATGQGSLAVAGDRPKEIGQTRADMVEGQGRMTALESFVQEIKEAQQKQDVVKDIMDLVMPRLQAFEERVDAKIQQWRASTIQGCQELEDRMDSLDGIRDQLGEIQRRETGIQNAFDVLLHRLERVESCKLCPIREESVSPPGQQTVDSVRSMPQSAHPSFAET